VHWKKLSHIPSRKKSSKFFYEPGLIAAIKRPLRRTLQRNCRKEPRKEVIVVQLMRKAAQRDADERNATQR